jgi:hypothetical protein
MTFICLPGKADLCIIPLTLLSVCRNWLPLFFQAPTPPIVVDTSRDFETFQVKVYYFSTYLQIHQAPFFSFILHCTRVRCPFPSFIILLFLLLPTSLSTNLRYQTYVQHKFYILIQEVLFNHFSTLSPSSVQITFI